jgi:prepilin-type N-terminal cleavage/methylation domain-containing protein
MRIPPGFTESAALLHLALATAFITAAVAGGFASPPDPLLGVPMSRLYWLAGIGHGAAGLACLLARSERVRLGATLLLALNLLLYALQTFADGKTAHVSARFISLADAFGLAPQAACCLVFVAEGCLMAGSALVLGRRAFVLGRAGAGRGANAGSAFTLIELLVTLAIITLLAGLLLPALAPAKEKARAARCLSNEKQISYGLKLFAEDNGGLGPLSGGEISWDLIDNDTHRPSWLRQIDPYVKNTNAYRCPADRLSGWSYFNSARAAYLAATNHYAAVDVKQIKYPSAFVASGDTLWFDASSKADADKDDYSQNCIGGPTNGTPFKEWRIHNRGQNVLFEDGHAQLYRRYNPAEMTFRYDILSGWKTNL